jgi:hypothetical protein
MGNEGVPFIAVNKFDPEELTAYKDLYLTSISAYINAKGREATTDTKLKLAVFIGNNRVVTQDIESYEGDTWNTFALNEPLKITADANLLFGIEVAEHDVYSYPLATDHSLGTKGKSDIYSEDGGSTWKSLADESYPYNWSIIGNVREAASTTERTPGVLGYEVYRGDVKINTGLTFGQAFVDTTLTDKEEVCYKVKAYYIFGGIAGFSEAGCAAKGSGIVTLSAENISIYPNPAGEWIYVDGNFSTVTLFDLMGRKALVAVKSPVDIQSLAAGTYAVEVVAPNGTKALSKVIIRK